MTSTRKTRNKRVPKARDFSPGKVRSNVKKNRPRKRKLSDMLGPQWSKEDIERFYDAYRKYGKDWKKVAGLIRNRSADMVEALYNMNRAYLSLPERTTSAAVLIAMMTDHYNILEGSDSERESNDESHKPKQRNRGKFKVNTSNGLDDSFPNLLQPQSVPSTYGCLSLLKKRSSGNGPRAVGKRTPRVPVSYDRDEKANTPSRYKKGVKPEVSADDYDTAHGAALALAGALQRGGSPQVSRTPSRKTNYMRSSPCETDEIKPSDSKFNGSEEDEYHLEGSVDSREAENGDFARDTSFMPDDEHDGGYGSQHKGIKFGKKRKVQGNESYHSDDAREACSGTEEGHRLRNDEDEDDVEAEENVPWQSQGPRKRSRQLFGDESTAFDALQTLAELSINAFLPASAAESESSVQVKEEKKNVDDAEKPTVPGPISFRSRRDRSKALGKKVTEYPSIAGIITSKNAKIGEGSYSDAVSEANAYHSTRKTVKRKKKSSLAEKVLKAETNGDSAASHKNEASEDGKKCSSKSKRSNQIIPPMKQGKSIKVPEQSSLRIDLEKATTEIADSIAQVPVKNQVNLPTKYRSRRKRDLQKALSSKDIKSSQNIVNVHPNKHLHQVLDQGALLKEKICHCLSSPLLRRWCAFEWFYSAIDYPWFAKSEFVEYLDHVGLGHIPRLTRIEWGVIRGSLGKPRRLSKAFLQEEREKLEKYRESVRSHYIELRSGIRDGLPTDLARPLAVGQRVIACHPKTREIRDGSVLTVDRNRCRVQFDRADLGVEFVLDIDCMPLNPLENIPEDLRRQNVIVDKFFNRFNETRPIGWSKEMRTGPISKPMGEMLEVADISQYIASTTASLSALMSQAKGDTIDDVVQAKAVANEISVAARQAMYNQPCNLAQMQACEADVRALSELSRALAKKEALLVELRNMNEEVSEKRIDFESQMDMEHFRKQYAMVLLQLRDANDQVGKALLCLRQRNTYNGNSSPWVCPPANAGLPVQMMGSADPAPPVQVLVSHVMEVVESARQKAKIMVDAAIQVMSSLNEGEDAFARVGDAIISTSKRHSGSDSGTSPARATLPCEPGHGISVPQDQAESATGCHTASSKQTNSTDGSVTQFPSELILSCVGTLLTIQMCSERQYPPGEAAKILDSVLTSLQPCCSQNLPIYREIEDCMGLIKNQMLSLIPT